MNENKTAYTLPEIKTSNKPFFICYESGMRNLQYVACAIGARIICRTVITNRKSGRINIELGTDNIFGGEDQVKSAQIYVIGDEETVRKQKSLISRYLPINPGYLSNNVKNSFTKEITDCF
jgi:hypothetical protein